jgi:hypothetical protein
MINYEQGEAMRAVIRGLIGGAALVAGVANFAAAQADANIETGTIGRFVVYTAPKSESTGQAFIDNNHVFMLDTYTGEVFTKLGGAEEWNPYAGGLNIGDHPAGGEWDKPVFSLAVATDVGGGDPTLLLTNTTTGATYTRDKKGDWTPFMRGQGE